MKAFIGIGLLGSGFVKAMLQKGDAVQVWNRTAAKAKALEAYGAKAFNRVEEAVQGAEIIHVTLKDDATVDEVLTSASNGLQQGAVIIDHTTTSVKGAIQRTSYWKSKGFTYLHAPVFMGPQNALESTGFMMVSGNQSVIEKYEPALSKMTGKLLNFGAEEGKAAGIKLSGNLFLLSLTAGLADALALAKVHNIQPSELLTLFNNWNPGASVPARLKKISEAKFNEPSWELNMARKDAGLMLSAAKEAGTNLTVIPAIAAVMDTWIAKGNGSDDWSVIAKDSL
ncbi:NAD(P)-dependent oxidoreductase [Panacibacter ginsenosidivorans]|uniref:NAD(P)-dependent oxidoreductase n=1 Tax=Panacibacter ginsenosidivorans TaxID=1813871 RepID=A0A5B8V5U2_9BACT|nr:NAD(P)-binding domain-containing protein [Panacibacter ginsenosidivorans]QEC66770.1 NAD(P)-dependent oxidoreductase [Panacibacter ginsenosidivorans]